MNDYLDSEMMTQIGRSFSIIICFCPGFAVHPSNGSSVLKIDAIDLDETYGGLAYMPIVQD